MSVLYSSRYVENKLIELINYHKLQGLIVIFCLIFAIIHYNFVINGWIALELSMILAVNDKLVNLYTIQYNFVFKGWIVFTLSSEFDLDI